ncbi:MAG: hypothetical protein JWN93_2485 [Hyphomicrobiales bacterium]|jgi:hypothetical protein|nr:hypothetical protein [Hyphomicrobiales bacterium]
MIETHKSAVRMGRVGGLLLACAAAVAVSAASFAPTPAQAKSKRGVHAQKVRAHQARAVHVYRRAPPRAVYYRRPAGVYIGGVPGGTYAAGPRSYGGDPADWRNVPVGVGYQPGCYGGREQVRVGNRLIWVPDVTCPPSDPF